MTVAKIIQVVMMLVVIVMIVMVSTPDSNLSSVIGRESPCMTFFQSRVPDLKLQVQII